MGRIEAWKAWASELKATVYALYFAYRDPRTPMHVRILAACVVGYAFSPIDLIPDPIPILGYLDDLVLIPLGAALVIRLLPGTVWVDAQAQAADALDDDRPTNWIAAVVVVALWIAFSLAAGIFMWRWIDR